MSFQELHIRALEDQVLNLTRDCHYLMSLLNSTDEIDWDSWEQGRRIKADLEHSKDFFEARQRREEKYIEPKKKEHVTFKQMSFDDLQKVIDYIFQSGF